MVAGPAATAFERAADALFTTSEYLSYTEEYRPAGCLSLNLHVGEVLDGWGDQPLEGEVRAALCSDLVAAVIRQHQGLIAGLATYVRPTEWGLADWLQFAARGGEAAEGLLLEVLQAQALSVEVQGRRVAIPAAPAVARLPPGHVQVTFRGVPFFYARQGFSEAMLAAAGYSAARGTCVAHERPGFQVGPDRVRLTGVPALDTVVSVVRTPPGDPALHQLPRGLQLGGVVVSISVQDGVVVGAGRPIRRTPAAAAPGTRRDATMARLGAAHGLTSAVLAAAPPLVADLLEPLSRAPGARGGLGFVPAGSAPPPPPPPPPPRAAAAPAPSLAPEFPMPDAEPPPAPPPDEPVFGAAAQLVEDFFSSEEAAQLVVAVRTQQPAVYAACAGASRPGDLSAGFRCALYTQAVALFGEQRALPLAPARAAAACLPASVLGAVGSDGEEEVAPHAAGEGSGAPPGLQVLPTPPPAAPQPGQGAASSSRSLQQRGRQGGSRSPQRQCQQQQQPPPQEQQQQPQQQRRTSSRDRRPASAWWAGHTSAAGRPEGTAGRRRQ